MEKVLNILNISSNELNRFFGNWRFDVLHVRGVDLLSSNDVYEYFNQRPVSIEWLSKISCNITFQSKEDACETLMDIAQGIIIHKNDINNDVIHKYDLNVFNSDELEIPVPPNYRYILGNKHENAKAIIIRFATVNDKKIADIESSQTMGNAKKKNTLESDSKFLPETLRTFSVNEIKSIYRNDTNQFKSSITFRMRADEEEERIKQSRIRQQNRFNQRDLRLKLSKSRRLSSNKIDKVKFQKNARIPIKMKQNNLIWRSSKKNQNQNVFSDLRLKLNEPLIRVQVTYDDDIIL